MLLKPENIAPLRGFGVEYFDTDGYIFSKWNGLYRFSATDRKPKLFAEIPLALPLKILCRFRLVQRLLRLFFYNVIRIDNDVYFVTYGKRLGILRNGIFEEVFTKQRCRILRNGAVLANDGNIYFGEYIPNPERREVAVYRLNPETLEVQVAHIFHAGEIRHVHGLYTDPYEPGTIWVTTGDLPQECRLLKTSDHFETIKMIWGLNETWRAVSLAFTENAIYYGTDAEFEQNYIYKIYRQTGELFRLQPLTGPCFYSKKIGKYLFFSVVAELCPSQSDRHAAVYALDSETDKAVRIFEAEKDFLFSRGPYSKEPLLARLLMYGTIQFAIGKEPESSMLISCTGLKFCDNSTWRISLQ